MTTLATALSLAEAANAVQPSLSDVSDPLAVVDKPSLRWHALAEERDLPRALMGGTRAMREAGRRSLPQHPAESEASYDLRLNATTLYNGFAETVVAQAGKFYAAPVVLKEDVPPLLAALCENIDGQGRALTPFAADVTKAAFVDGVASSGGTSSFRTTGAA